MWGAQLLPTNGMRAGRRAIGVAEAEDVHAPAGTRHRCRAPDVVSPLVVVERMEQRAVEHRVEHSAQTIEVESVTDNESASMPRAVALSRAMYTALAATSTPRTWTLWAAR